MMMMMKMKKKDCFAHDRLYEIEMAMYPEDLGRHTLVPCLSTVTEGFAAVLVNRAQGCGA